MILLSVCQQAALRNVATDHNFLLWGRP